jgi:phosphatidylinositol alpha-mannosyltransferase
MRIAQVCPYSLTRPGGAQRQALGLARAQRHLGHEVRVLAPCDGPPPDAGVTPLGRSIPVAANGSIAPIAPDPSCVLRTIRALRDEDFDVVHLHEPLCPGPTLTALLVSDKPTIGTFHRFGRVREYAWFGPAARWAADHLAVRCAVSEDARQTAAESLGGEYEMLFNGIDVERFAKAVPQPVDGPTIFFLGRHEPRKGLGVLLDALARLPADVRVWVASDGPQTAELRQRHAGDDRIEWLGPMPDDEVAIRMRSADVFCAPSLGGESFGVVLLEAMAASTAIVASDLPGYRRVARPDEHALLVPPGDDVALGAALGRLLGDAALRRSLVEAGDQRANEFSMDRLAERYLDLYERVTTTPRR